MIMVLFNTNSYFMTVSLISIQCYSSQGVSPPHPSGTDTSLANHGSLHVIVAAGPFTTSDCMSYEPLQDLCTMIEEKSPDVCVMVRISDSFMLELWTVDTMQFGFHSNGYNKAEIVNLCDTCKPRNPKETESAVLNVHLQ